MDPEQIEAIRKETEWGGGFGKRLLIRHAISFGIVMSGILLFRVMDWPRSTAAFMGVFFFLQIMLQPDLKSAPPTPRWRTFLLAAAFGLFGWWVLSDL